MKKYSAYSPLNEAAPGYDNMTVGGTYTSKKGNKMKILSIHIDASSLVPDVFVNYEYTTSDGKTGKEENRFSVFIDMLRND